MGSSSPRPRPGRSPHQQGHGTKTHGVQGIGFRKHADPPAGGVSSGKALTQPLVLGQSRENDARPSASGQTSRAERQGFRETVNPFHPGEGRDAPPALPTPRSRRREGAKARPKTRKAPPCLASAALPADPADPRALRRPARSPSWRRSAPSCASAMTGSGAKGAAPTLLAAHAIRKTWPDPVWTPRFGSPIDPAPAPRTCSGRLRLGSSVGRAAD